MRFYALRLHEAKIIKSSPQKILAQGADWRILNEVKKELKGWTLVSADARTRTLWNGW